jgi:hypothetical protein
VFYDDEFFLIFSIITIISFELLQTFRFFFHFLDLIIKSTVKVFFRFVPIVTVKIRINIIISFLRIFFLILSCWLPELSTLVNINVLLEVLKLGFFESLI